jgi:hypothetical protein
MLCKPLEGKLYKNWAHAQFHLIGPLKPSSLGFNLPTHKALGEIS